MTTTETLYVLQGPTGLIGVRNVRPTHPDIVTLLETTNRGHALALYRQRCAELNRLVDICTCPTPNRDPDRTCRCHTRPHALGPVDGECHRCHHPILTPERIEQLAERGTRR